MSLALREARTPVRSAKIARRAGTLKSSSVRQPRWPIGLREPPRRLGAFGIREQPGPSRLPDRVLQRELRSASPDKPLRDGELVMIAEELRGRPGANCLNRKDSLGQVRQLISMPSSWSGKVTFSYPLAGVRT